MWGNNQLDILSCGEYKIFQKIQNSNFDIRPYSHCLECVKRYYNKIVYQGGVYKFQMILFKDYRSYQVIIDIIKMFVYETFWLMKNSWKY